MTGFDEHKEYTAHCNMCGYDTKHDENGCAWHQQVLTDSEGIQYLRYEEFDQNGEA